ncbi:MAG: WD40 repeat domain-containing protein [Planctomycetia bacterium]|nr:WD40 repeat domain-containing protein [Planctomycetia bacterium]
MWIQRVPGGGVSILTYSPDGRTLYTFDRGRYLVAWDITTHERRKLGNIGWKELSQPQAIHALADGQRLVGVGRAAVVVWDIATAKELLRVERPTGYSDDSVCVTPDGRVYFANHPNPEIRGYNLTTGNAELTRTMPGFKNQIRHFHLSPNERSLAVVFNNFTAELFDWNAEQELRHSRSLGVASNLRFSPDSRTLAICKAAPPRTALRDLATHETRVEDIRCWMTDALFAFNPAFPLLAALGPNKLLTLFSSETGQPIRSLDFSLGLHVQSIVFSPDGLTCAVGGSNKQFAVFDVDV